MSKWDRRMLGLANLVATWSKDPSTGVGAVIVDAKNRVVSLGYNGFPRAVCDSDEALFDRDEKLRRTIHAEENALLFAGRPVEGCTLYVTHPPCARCAAKIIQAGVARVVAQMPAEGFGERWAADMRSASAMFLEAGVGFEYVGGVRVSATELEAMRNMHTVLRDCTLAVLVHLFKRQKFLEALDIARRAERQWPGLLNDRINGLQDESH